MRTTITFNDKLFKNAKVYAASSGVTLSSFVQEAVKNQLLEDAEDAKAVKTRQNESLHSFDKLVEEFKADGLI
jgi:hypothetical protein